MESHRRILFETASHRQAPLLQHGWIAGIYNKKRSFVSVSALVSFPIWMVCRSLYSSMGSGPGREKVNKKKSYVCVERLAVQFNFFFLQFLTINYFLYCFIFSKTG
jgi:hypothetical protein